MKMDSIKNKSNKMCSVPNCSSYCDKKSNISLHKFPKETFLKKKWIHVTRIAKKVTGNYYVCSNHFEDSNYKNMDFKCHLKKGVVPSRNLPVVTNYRRSAVIERSSRLLNKVSNVQQQKNINDQSAAESLPTASITIHNILNEEQNTSLALRKETVDIGVQANVVLNTVIERDIARYSRLSIDDLIINGAQLNIMTSLNDSNTIQLLENSIRNLDLELTLHSRIFNSQMLIKHKILLVLIKLKQNLDFSVLSVLFGISIPSSIKFFKEMLPVMRAGLKSLIYWPSRDEVKMNIPQCFEEFSDVRAILDCTEIEISQSKCLKCKIISYSHYKGTNTVKFLVAISPAGLITYISKGYSGKASDKFIFNEEHIIDLFEYEDGIMVDKGFAIESELRLKGVKLYKPTFKDSKRQFGRSETLYNTNIASARVHVERAIQRIKIYKILSAKIDNCLFPAIDDIFNIICSLVNLSKPILDDNKF